MSLSKVQASGLSCNASNCTHWLPGNRCDAARIRVADQAPGRPAANAGDTYCRTFVYKRGVGQVLAALGNMNWGGLAREPLAEGVQMTPGIDCSVQSCLFRGEEGGCGAEFVHMGGEGATEAGETDCSTFLPTDG